MDSQAQLTHYLAQAGVLRTRRIVDAFFATDRKDFVPQDWRGVAYIDDALPIGYGQTISQPYTVAFMLELLQPQQGDKILDVGAGSAWTTALLAYITGQNGEVFGVEVIPELVELGKQNLATYQFSNARIVQAGKKLGLPSEAPFDKILASAAAEKLPQELVRQLKVGGTLVIPVQHDVLKITKTSKKETDIQTFPGFAFVPLV